MLEVRLKSPARAPSARLHAVARLSAHRIRFHKIGQDGSGKCNALSTGRSEDCVHGVVFEIDERDLDALDELEDVERGGYRRVRGRVETSSGPCVAEYYVACAPYIDEDLMPFEWYRDLVVAGAQEHALPDDYVSTLREHPARRDTDTARATRAQKLLDGAR